MCTWKSNLPECEGIYGSFVSNCYMELQSKLAGNGAQNSPTHFYNAHSIIKINMFMQHTLLVTEVELYIWETVVHSMRPTLEILLLQASRPDYISQP